MRVTTDLHLAHNRLSGPVPAWLGDLTNLWLLYLAANDLSGPVPPELGNLTELKYLSLRGNQVHGPIPETPSDWGYPSLFATAHTSSQ